VKVDLKRFFAIWDRLLWWERELMLWFGYLVVGRRAILPIVSFQAGGLAVIMWATPHPLIWMLVYILSFVYILLAFSLVRRWL
jgi:hypothetical protein